MIKNANVIDDKLTVGKHEGINDGNYNAYDRENVEM